MIKTTHLVKCATFYKNLKSRLFYRCLSSTWYEPYDKWRQRVFSSCSASFDKNPEKRRRWWKWNPDAIGSINWIDELFSTLSSFNRFSFLSLINTVKRHEDIGRFLNLMKYISWKFKVPLVLFCRGNEFTHPELS